MKVLLLGFLFMCFAGCASSRLYPVCFYNQQPSEQSVNSYYLPRLQQLLKDNLGTGRQVGVQATPDGRWLTARTTDTENSNIAKIWSRVGCIGQALNSNEVNEERQCALYVDNFIRQGNYLQFGNAKDEGGIDVWNEAQDGKSIVFCHQIGMP